MEAIPRISRAQSMDALSSQSNVAGYEAVVRRGREPRPLLPDADDRRRHDPARQGARPGRRRRRDCRRSRRRAASGAVTVGYDVRPEVAEQVESLGAKFLDLGPRGRRRGRLRARADRRGARPAAAGADRRDQGLRRRHHDRAGARPPGAEARHRGGRPGYEGRQRDRRPGR